jgi:hypothetical protein
MGGVCAVLERGHFCPCNAYRDAQPERRRAPAAGERPKLTLVHSAPALSPTRARAPRLEPLPPLERLPSTITARAPAAAAPAPRAPHHPTPRPVESPERRETHDVVGVCKSIASALRQRSGKAWSVTRGRGTVAGWITIQSPPARRTPDYGYMTEADRMELARLLGLPTVHEQGIAVPAGTDYRLEFLQRARTGSATVHGKPYWD